MDEKDSETLRMLTAHEHEIKSLKHRMDGVEQKQDSINSLTVSVNELATNMKYMLEEQKEQGTRLSALEKEPAETAKYYKRTIITAVITTVIGAVVGALIALLA